MAERRKANSRRVRRSRKAAVVNSTERNRSANQVYFIHSLPNASTNPLPFHFSQLVLAVLSHGKRITIINSAKAKANSAWGRVNSQNLLVTENRSNRRKMINNRPAPKRSTGTNSRRRRRTWKCSEREKATRICSSWLARRRRFTNHWNGKQIPSQLTINWAWDSIWTAFISTANQPRTKTNYAVNCIPCCVALRATRNWSWHTMPHVSFNACWNIRRRIFDVKFPK